MCKFRKVENCVVMSWVMSGSQMVAERGLDVGLATSEPKFGNGCGDLNILVGHVLSVVMCSLLL